MGSSKPRDSSTMNTASSGATQADAALAQTAQGNQKFSNAARKTLFGYNDQTGQFEGGGTLTPFLDTSKLDVSAPTGTYKLQYNQAKQNIANQGTANRGALARSWAQRGFGGTPAGFTQDQLRQEMADESGQQGAAFTDLSGKSYQDVLQNFWRATGALSGEGDTALSAAISADTSAANNYANLYGTASTPKPSAMGQILGAGIQGGSQIGAAAVTCPCEGALITMHDGSKRLAETIRKGEEFRGIDGKPCPVLEDPRMTMRPAVEVETLNRKSRVSYEHTFSLPCGGYEYAAKSQAKNVRTEEAIETVMKVTDIAEQPVYVFIIGGSHSYCVDGIWALS